MLEQLKEELYQLHLELVKYNLVVWTGGNISARDPDERAGRDQAVGRAL